MTASGEHLADFAARAAEHLADVAARLVRPTQGGRAGQHEWTSATQVRTEADERAGAALHELFSASFPGHGLIIEDRDPVAGEGLYEWAIDPIDGSANHLRGVPYVALSAGLRRDGEPVVGVVHDVLRGGTYLAHRGGGARVVDADGTARALRVAATAELADAMTILHLARRGPVMNLEGALARLLWSVRKIRCMGSIALDLVLLAEGAADLLVAGRGTPQRELDILGGQVVLQEAGGALVDADGAPFTSDSRTLIAGPPALCEQFTELMRDFEMETWTADRARNPTI